MAFIIGLLTFILVLNCLALILLVLIQLPKKEAGAGLAFGGAATDALFAAGSGNMLTKITKYAAILFFVLSLGLGILQSVFGSRSGSSFERELENQNRQPPAGLVQPPVEAAPPAALPAPAAPATTN